MMCGLEDGLQEAGPKEVSLVEGSGLKEAGLEEAILEETGLEEATLGFWHPPNLGRCFRVPTLRPITVRTKQT